MDDITKIALEQAGWKIGDSEEFLGFRGFLVVLRGTPGSGKSHLAARLAPKENIFSTDEWFELQPGGYRENWKVEKLFGAHRWNQQRAREAMQRGITPLVIDDTNWNAKQARPYVEMALQYQYHVTIRESDSPWWSEIALLLESKKFNEGRLKVWAEKLANGFDYEGKKVGTVHGVPAEKIFSMFMDYRPYTLQDVLDRIKQGPE